jgi:hypothetical protein
MQEEPPPKPEDFSRDESKAGSFLLGFVGAVTGLVAGFLLFVTTYRPISGLGGTPVWQVSVMDGAIIAAAGAFAFVFRKKSAFLQGIMISASFLFIVNGLCGLSGR